MSTLHDEPNRVHSNAAYGDEPAYRPSDSDAAWWAAASASAEAPAGECLLSDAAWLEGEAGEFAGAAHPHRYDTAGFVRDTLRAAARGVRTSRGKTARDAARCRRADLDAVRLPVTPRRSRFAEELDALAAWYLHLDTDAGRWAAWHLLWQADLADEMGSESAEDWLVDEAAWRAAMLDAVGA